MQECFGARWEEGYNARATGRVPLLCLFTPRIRSIPQGEIGKTIDEREVPSGDA
jgi:hypothetical protein